MEESPRLRKTQPRCLPQANLIGHDPPRLISVSQATNRSPYQQTLKSEHSKPHNTYLFKEFCPGVRLGAPSTIAGLSRRGPRERMNEGMKVFSVTHTNGCNVNNVRQLPAGKSGNSWFCLLHVRCFFAGCVLLEAGSNYVLPAHLMNSPTRETRS